MHTPSGPGPWQAARSRAALPVPSVAAAASCPVGSAAQRLRHCWVATERAVRSGRPPRPGPPPDAGGSSDGDIRQFFAKRRRTEDGTVELILQEQPEQFVMEVTLNQRDGDEYYEWDAWTHGAWWDDWTRNSEWNDEETQAQQAYWWRCRFSGLPGPPNSTQRHRRPLRKRVA